MRTARARRGGTSGGFTLVELLVATALLGLVALLAAGGADFGARSWERVRATSAALDEARATETALRELIGAAQPAFDEGDDLAPRPVFAGGPDRLTLAAPIGRGLEAPGQQRVTIALERRDEAGAPGRLVARFRPLRAGAEGRELVSELASAVRGVAFAYFGATADGGGDAWSAEWRDRAEPPRLVRVAVDFAELAPWPPIVIATALDLAAACPTPAATAGCRAVAEAGRR